MSNKEELINKLKYFSKIIEDSPSDCANCGMYEICIEKYSDNNLINLLNETIEYIKETED